MRTLSQLAIENPIKGMGPDFKVFGADFDTWWKKGFAALWAMAVIVAIIFMLRALVGMLENRGNHPGALKESRSAAVQSALVLGGIVGLGPIVSAILAVAG